MSRLFVAVAILFAITLSPSMFRTVSSLGNSRRSSADDSKLPFNNSLNSPINDLTKGRTIEETHDMRFERWNLNRMIESREERNAMLSGAILSAAWLIASSISARKNAS
ncbi:hypothetical protein [Rosistilla ulvae]|nr:hypothetical protein [Rosistilla ulvae]